MKEIWYLLKCPEGDEENYKELWPKFVIPEELEEIICFQYQRMIRYRGQWHIEKRVLLPGCIFLSVSKEMKLKEDYRKSNKIGREAALIPCATPYLKDMCQEGDVVCMSRGVIRNGKPMIISGPLKGRERLILKIDRHKRTAEIEIPFPGDKRQVTVGLEIYEKEM